MRKSYGDRNYTFNGLRKGRKNPNSPTVPWFRDTIPIASLTSLQAKLINSLLMKILKNN
jgi:hypothetical protein